LLDVPSGQGPYWFCVPPSWPWLTRQALLRGPAGRRVPRDKGRWPRQATEGCRLGHTVTQGPRPRSACPSRGDTHTLRHLGLAGSPHQPQRGQRQRLGRFLRVPLPFQQVLPCSRDAARSRRWGSADAALGEGLQTLSTLSAFLYKFAWKYEGCRAQPARRGRQGNMSKV